ncbi:hypothetical protein NDU88_005785 [Pleurodeles waltl]|uniref:Uncharacterized protein n=1 Tax=Pleurodeles waltl TaxID=8319 RepID=A0AAV7VM84_PLEWA|nr:hypothetical protein NDU88_005785 [Pleurodeles waltl]
MRLDWGKAGPTKEYAGDDQGCKDDDMELNYFEDSPEYREIMDGDSDTEGEIGERIGSGKIDEEGLDEDKAAEGRLFSSLEGAHSWEDLEGSP